MKFKTTFVGEQTTYLTLNEWVNTYVVILPKEKWNQIYRMVHLLLWSSFPSFLSFIFTTTNSNDRPSIDGKIQPNAGLTFKPNFDVLNSNIECVNAFSVSSAEVTNSTPYWAQ